MHNVDIHADAFRRVSRDCSAMCAYGLMSCFSNNNAVGDYLYVGDALQIGNQTESVIQSNMFKVITRWATIARMTCKLGNDPC